MLPFAEVVSTLYVALTEAAGGEMARRAANSVILDAISNGAVTDPAAVDVLRTLASEDQTIAA